MYKVVLRLARVTLIWTMIFLLSVDTAMACGLLARLRDKQCATRTACQADTCCATAEGGKDVAKEGTGSSVQKSEPGDALKVEKPTPAPAKPAEIRKPSEPEKKIRAEEPAKPQPPAASKPVMEKPAPTPAPTPAPKPALSAPAAPATKPEAKPAEPAKPVEAKPAPTPAPTPAPKPALSAPAAPAKQPEAKPAEPSKPVAPAVPAKDPLEDLFGSGSAKAASKPAETLTPAQPAEPSKPAAPAKDPLEDLFGTPAAKPEGAAKPKSGDQSGTDLLNDLFGGTPTAPAKPRSADSPAPPAKPAEKPAAPAAGSDPFSVIPPSLFESLATRRWVDSSGTFEVNARLSQILDGKVRLLKDNGRTCTVPVSRLSQKDAVYVQEIVAAYDSEFMVRIGR